MTNVIDFQNVKHFVLLHLLMPGATQTIANTYPNCHAVWTGDTLNIVPVGKSNQQPRASYHRSIVMLCEEHGEPPRYIPTEPPQNGPTSPVRTSGSPAVPDAEQTQQMAPVTAAERMEPVRKPTVAELQAQHIATLTEISQNLPKPAPHSPTALATIEKAKRNYAERQASFGHVERKSPPGDVSQVASTSADLVPSRWQSLKQIVRRSDGEQIEMTYDSRSGKNSATSHTSHRLPKFFKTRKWARRTKRAVVLAFALYAASFWPEPI